jgi:sortase A
MSRRWRLALAALLMLAAAGLAGQALWLQAKAVLAQHLIADAWAQSLRTGQPVKPWRWADTWPVARLTEPGGRQHHVLASVSGEALAFGPGHHPASCTTGRGGHGAAGGPPGQPFRLLAAPAAR